MKKRILVAPLNWGLGHATRCIPIINALKASNFEPIIASDGMALELLKKQFPELTCLELPSYGIKYSKKSSLLKLKLLKDSPKLLAVIAEEKKATKAMVEKYDLDGVISDNRFGVYSKRVPSVFLTHQLKVLSGNTTWLSTKIHQSIIKKFDECWIPDVRHSPNLSGELGHTITSDLSIKYIGPLSQFKKQHRDVCFDIMILLSGPEPQRKMLEEKLFIEFKNYNGSLLFVKGIIEKESVMEHIGTMTVCNYLLGSQLEKALNESSLIVSRSGYSTIMDLAKLGKKAFFIPTPGQFEQEYLAKRLTDQGLVGSCNQKEFNIEKLNEASNFSGLQSFDYEVNYQELFQLFESK